MDVTVTSAALNVLRPSTATFYNHSFAITIIAVYQSIHADTLRRNRENTPNEKKKAHGRQAKYVLYFEEKFCCG
ncbi:MAG: hypothetical protein F4Y81_09195 [Rhodothermaceae bacterium]|nr:hypothetical protein [Rhodothermaceae bacterium]MYG68843.1 hypothetical protein [Rhodothermaceae bacterium]